MQFENEIIKMSFENGVLIARYKEGVYIDLAQAKNVVKERLKLTNNVPHAVMVTGGPIQLTPESRKYALTKESSKNITFWAIVSDQSLFKSVFLKILFFTQGKYNKIRFFEKEEEGMSWLKEEMSKPAYSHVSR